MAVAAGDMLKGLEKTGQKTYDNEQMIREKAGETQWKRKREHNWKKQQNVSA
ncbi:hypothetical protein WAL18_29220 [Waltera acetigignens]